MIFGKKAMKAMILAIVIGAAGSASAQSTDGAISGTAVEGETLVIKGDNGIHREIQIDKTGTYKVRRLPLGSYSVIRLNAEGEVVSSQSADVVVGRTVRLM